MQSRVEKKQVSPVGSGDWPIEGAIFIEFSKE